MQGQRSNMVLGSAFMCMVGLLCGCQTPTTPETEIVPFTSINEHGTAPGSYEVVSVSSLMAPKILAVPEIARKEGVVKLALSRMKNNSSFPMDMNIFMKSLRAELVKVGGGKIRFFSQDNESVEKMREDILREQMEAERERMLDEVADAVVNQPVLKNTRVPVLIAITPVLNVNFVNLNADSYIAMLQARISKRGNDKIRFTNPGELKGADFFLTGQFIADIIKKEGMVNLVDYIALLEERLQTGKSLDVYNDPATGILHSSLMLEIQKNAKLRDVPKGTKKLNVMLIEASTRTSVLDKMFDIERELKTGLGGASYILSGEISSISKRAEGKEVTYILVAMQLVDPLSNEIIWENTFEIKKASNMGIVY